MKVAASILSLWLGSALALAQNDPRSARSPTYAGVPSPNLSLPAHVKAEDGKLTLYADFAHADDKGIPLYLVNRTDKEIPLNSQSGDVYIKLERQLPSGAWERAQPHAYSDCGLSYNGRSLAPGMHFRMYGFRPARGQPAKIRYTSYGPLEFSSNIGDGIYHPQDVSFAELDQMSLRDIPRSISEWFDQEQSKWHENPSTHVAALRMAEFLGEVQAIRTSALFWSWELEKLEKPEPEEQQALPLVQEILQRKWGQRGGLQRLLEACLAAVKTGNPANANFGTMEKESLLTWSVISEIGQLETGFYGRSLRVPRSDMAVWKEVMQLAATKLLTAPRDEAEKICALLRIWALTEESLPDEAFEPLLESATKPVAWVAAGILSKRGRWERLAELGFKLKPANQVIVLVALARGPYWMEEPAINGLLEVRNPPSDSNERTFWLHVLETQPVQAAAALSLSSPVTIGRHNPFRIGSEYLRSYWQQEAERSDRDGKDFDLDRQAYEYRTSIDFIAGWRDKQDVPLLQSLLRYRGYEVQLGAKFDTITRKSVPFEKRLFRIRKTAAEALMRRGETVPEDVVFEVEVKPAESGTK